MKLNGKEIFSIKRDVPDTTIIDWVLGNYCNFKCSYCFPNANTGTDRVPNFTIDLKRNIYHLMDQIDSVGKQNIVFNFGGGEPTLYRDIVKLIDFLKPFGQIGFVSNGSRTVRWWKQNLKFIDHLLLSYHSEFTDLEHMSKVIECTMNDVGLRVHVMVNRKLFEKCINSYKILIKRFPQVSIQLKTLRENGRVIEYSENEKIIISENISKPVMKPTCKVDCENNIFDFQLHHIKDLEGNFTGYKCYAHHDYLQIDSKGNIGRMSCGQKFTKEANLYSKSFINKFKLPKYSIICEQDICGCIGLLCSKKEKI